VPKDTPADVVRKLNETLTDILKMDDIRKRITFTGLSVPPPHTPQQLTEFIQKDYLRWQQAAKVAKITLAD
jgi:tripartite-type tricarboxylate transporter receptor subunit TctC